jgi:hypothetical protein
LFSRKRRKAPFLFSRKRRKAPFLFVRKRREAPLFSGIRKTHKLSTGLSTSGCVSMRRRDP